MIPPMSGWVAFLVLLGTIGLALALILATSPP